MCCGGKNVNKQRGRCDSVGQNDSLAPLQRAHSEGKGNEPPSEEGNNVSKEVCKVEVRPFAARQDP